MKYILSFIKLIVFPIIFFLKRIPGTINVKKYKKNVGTYLLIPLLWLACFSTSGYSESAVTWAYFPYPPLFILENEKDPAGFGFDIINLAVSTMPEYKHIFKKMSIKRFAHQMKTEENCICVYGMIKTPDREKWAYFSHPSRIVFPRMIVIRKNDLIKFGGGGAVSLSELINRKELVLLLKKGTRYGKRIDKILNENSGLKNISYLYMDKLGLQELRMLMARRGDYFLSLHSTLYDAKKLRHTDKIALIPIKGETYLTGSVACSKNERGRQVIDKVNRMLRKEIVSGKIYNILNRWVPDEMRREFKRQYKMLLVKPLKQ